MDTVFLMKNVVFGLLRRKSSILICATGAGPFSEVILLSDFAILLLCLLVDADEVTLYQNQLIKEFKVFVVDAFVDVKL